MTIMTIYRTTLEHLDDVLCHLRSQEFDKSIHSSAIVLVNDDTDGEV